MFYTATTEQMKQLHPELVNFEPDKTRCFYHYEDGTTRWFDRIFGYYFSDKPWGLEQEYLTEGLDQEWTGDYVSLNIRNSTLRAPDGWTEVCCDFSGEELRLGAINTRCKAYMEAFLNDEDVHYKTALTMFGPEKLKQDKKKYRSKAKQANFGLGYGGSYHVLEKTAGMTPEEAQEVYNSFKEALSDHFAVQDAQVRKTHQTLSEHSFFGMPVRLHRYYRSNSYKDISAGERLAKNHRIQASGADILSMAFVKLWKKIYLQLEHPEDYIRFNLTVHDEIDFYVRNECLSILVPMIIDCMTTQMSDWPFPIIVGLSMGPTLGQLYEWHYDTKENGYKVLAPDMEPEKKKEVKKEEVIQEVEEDIKLDV